MAEYENLTTLEGLQIGDTVKYTANYLNQKVWNLETKGYKFKIAMNGETPTGAYRTRKAGQTIANINCKNIPNVTLYGYRDSMGLAYGTYSSYNDLINYRLLVSGGAGLPSSLGSYREIGAGGGETGGRADHADSAAWVDGGTQTGSGYISGAVTFTKTGKGTFGHGASINYNERSTIYSVHGGEGWYGGSAGLIISGNTVYTYSAGGSGFIIGKTTTTYPSGYLGDDTALQSSLASAISNASTTQGGSDGTGTIILTILALPGTDIGNSIKYYTNGIWKDATMKVYTNGVWKSASPKVYKGSSWK